MKTIKYQLFLAFMAIATLAMVGCSNDDSETEQPNVPEREDVTGFGAVASKYNIMMPTSLPPHGASRRPSISGTVRPGLQTRTGRPPKATH